jgi:hypothetical protein
MEGGMMVFGQKWKKHEKIGVINENEQRGRRRSVLWKWQNAVVMEKRLLKWKKVVRMPCGFRELAVRMQYGIRMRFFRKFIWNIPRILVENSIAI